MYNTEDFSSSNIEKWRNGRRYVNVKVVATKLRELEVDAGKHIKNNTLILFAGSNPVLTTKN